MIENMFWLPSKERNGMGARLDVGKAARRQLRASKQETVANLTGGEEG